MKCTISVTVFTTNKVVKTTGFEQVFKISHLGIEVMPSQIFKHRV